jgi:hypothetical protein
VPVQIAPGGALVLQVGDHTLEFRAPGRVSETRRLKIQGGEEKNVHVALAPVAAANPSTRDAAPNSKRPLYKSPWLWGAVGVVLAGAGVALGVGLANRGTDIKTSAPEGGSTGITLAGPR